MSEQREVSYQPVISKSKSKMYFFWNMDILLHLEGGGVGPSALKTGKLTLFCTLPLGEDIGIS